MSSIFVWLALIPNPSLFAATLIPVDKAYQLQRAGSAKMVDVREATEFEFNHVKGAQNFAWSHAKLSDPAWRNFIKQFSRTDVLLFYCGNGVRAIDVAALASAQGMKAHAFNWQDWKSAKLPVAQRAN